MGQNVIMYVSAFGVSNYAVEGTNILEMLSADFERSVGHDTGLVESPGSRTRLWAFCAGRSSVVKEITF